MAIRLKGMDKALSNLNKEVEAIKGRTKRGMIAAGLHVQRAAMKRVPIQTGNLRASAFTVWGGKAGGSSPIFKGPDSGIMAARHSKEVAARAAGLRKNAPTVEVGFTSAYALVVHEDLEAEENRARRREALEIHKAMGGKQGTLGILQSTVGEAKFLENALTKEFSAVLGIIAGEAKT